jgi:uncharacterized repeat protein (TIGR03943 family)
MRRETQHVLLALLGGALVRIAVDDTHLRYVRPEHRWLLIGAGAVMTGLAVVALVRDMRAGRFDGPQANDPGGQADDRSEPESGNGAIGPPAQDRRGPRLRGAGALVGSGTAVDRDPPGHHAGDHGRPGGGNDGTAPDRASPDRASPDEAAGRHTAQDHGTHDHGTHDDGTHDHGSVERHVPWLLLAPVLVIALVAPPALGADAVSRAGARNAVVQDSDVFAPLPAGTAPELTVAEFVQRAAWDSAGSLNGRDVTLTGFTVQRGAATELARMTIACCAADARPNRVRLVGDVDAEPDTWLRVRGTVQPGSATAATGYVPALTVTDVEVVPAPPDPYEY